MYGIDLDIYFSKIHRPMQLDLVYILLGLKKDVLVKDKCNRIN